MASRHGSLDVDVFMSYAREDYEFVEQLVQIIAGWGWKVWWDADLLPGVPFRDQIDIALGNAKCVVVLWSQHSINSHYVLDESQEALDRKILIPIKFSGTRAPRGFGQIHYEEFGNHAHPDDAKAIRGLKESISQLCAHRPVAPAQPRQPKQPQPADRSLDHSIGQFIRLKLKSQAPEEISFSELANDVSAVFPSVSSKTSWSGAGSFRGLLERVRSADIVITQTFGGSAKYSAAAASAPAAVAASPVSAKPAAPQPAPRPPAPAPVPAPAPTAAPDTLEAIRSAASVPLIPQDDYVAAFRAIAKASGSGARLSEFVKQVRDLAAKSGKPISNANANHLIKGAHFGGLDVLGVKHEPVKVAQAFLDHAYGNALKNGRELSEADYGVLRVRIGMEVLQRSIH